MLPERVDEMLKNYKELKGRCEHLKLEISLAQAQLEESAALRAEAHAYHVQQYENMDMPRSTGIGNPTERLGIALATCSEVVDARDHRWVEEMQREYNQKIASVHFVDTWLANLPEKERWLINEQIIEGRYWREITRGWKAKFGDELGKEALKKLKAKAKEKIYQMAG